MGRVEEDATQKPRSLASRGGGKHAEKRRRQEKNVQQEKTTPETENEEDDGSGEHNKCTRKIHEQATISNTNMV